MAGAPAATTPMMRVSGRRGAEPGADAAGQRAIAKLQNDDLGPDAGLGELEADDARPGRDLAMGAVLDQHRTAVASDGGGQILAVAIAGSDQADFGAEPAHRLELQGVGAAGRQYGSAHAAPRRRARHALAEIAGRGRDHRLRHVLEPGEERLCPAPLEGADRIEGLDLEPEHAIEGGIERGLAERWRSEKDRVDRLLRRGDFGGRDQLRQGCGQAAISSELCRRAACDPSRAAARHHPRCDELVPSTVVNYKR